MKLQYIEREYGFKVATQNIMTKPKLFKEEPKKVRDILNQATELSDQIHRYEMLLISLLVEIDHKRYYVRYGFKSLRGYCVQGLLFSKTQAQRVATRVRRASTPDDDSQDWDLKTFIDRT